MKRHVMSVVAISLLAWSLSSASAQEARQRAGQNRAAQGQPGGALTPAALDDKTSGATFRVSQLIGTNIQNDRGENVGEIHDLVLDANTRRVRYAAVTYGGFLGLGDKLFAVPFEAFKVRQDPDDADDYVLILNVTKEQLDGAQGFDKDQWPDMANAQWAQELDKRYGVERDRNRSGGTRPRGGVDVNVDRRNGVDVDVNRNPTDADRE